MRVLIFDGLNFIRRIFSAVPDHTRSGNPTPTDHPEGVLHSVLAAAERAIKHHQPSHAVIVFETAGQATWRHELFPDYKGDRKPQPQELVDLLPRIKAELKQHGIESVQADHFEADDTIATISTRLANNEISSLILSTDHLLCQLIQPLISIFDHFQNRPLDTTFIVERYGIQPAQLPDFYALAGHSSVSIPGISGIGPKTATELLQAHPDIDAVLEDMEEFKENIAKKLKGKELSLHQYKTLFTLRQNVKIDANLNQWRLNP